MTTTIQTTTVFKPLYWLFLRSLASRTRMIGFALVGILILIAAIVEAVPITAHVPAVVTRRPSTSEISCSVISPARNLTQNLRQSVHAPTRSSR